MTERRLKLLATLGFGTLAVVAATAATSHAGGYEISVYRAYPIWFWLGFVAVVAAGTGVLLGSVNADHRRRFSGLGVTMILLANALLLFMPLIRGYFGYGGGDMLTHRGYLLDIRELNRLSATNYYPGIHVHVFAVTEIIGLDFFTVKSILTPLFSVAYWLGLLALGTELFDDSAKLHYLAPFALLPVFKHWETYLGGHMTSFAVLPLLLYAVLAVRRRRQRFLVVVTVLFAYLVFTHPVTTLAGLFAVGLVGASRYVSARLRGRPLSVRRSFPVFTLPIAVGVAFYAWYYSFESIVYMTVGMLVAIFGGSGSPQVSEYSSALSQMPFSTVDIVKLVVFRKGSELLLGLATTAAVVYLANEIRKGELRLDWSHLFAVATFGVFSVFTALFLVNPVMLDWVRIFKYAQFAAVLILAMAAYAYVNATPRRRRRLVAVGLLAVVLSALVVFGTYSSPLTREPNAQITESRVEAMDWFTTHWNESRGTYGFNYRYLHALSGVESNPALYSTWTDSNVSIPDHFGYDDSATFATPEREGNYVVVTEKLRRWYPELHPDYPEQWRYAPRDFRKAERDEGLAKIYENGAVRVYKVRQSSNRTATESQTRNRTVIGRFPSMPVNTEPTRSCDCYSQLSSK